MRRIIVGKVSLSLSLYIYYMSYKHYADSNLDWTLLESYRSLGGVRKETEWNMNGIWIWLVVFANVSILSQCRGEAHSTARESAEFGSRQLGKKIRNMNGIWMESEFDWSSLLMFQFCRSAAVKHTVQLGKSQSLDRDSSVTFEFGAQLARFVGSNSVAAPSPQSITSCCSTWVGFQGRKIWTESERFGNNFWNLKGIWM